MNKLMRYMTKTDIETWFSEDTKSPECFANKKRLHNPPNREAATAFEMHEIIKRMFGMSIVADSHPELFARELEMLKIAISSYEQLKEQK